MCPDANIASDPRARDTQHDPADHKLELLFVLQSKDLRN